MKLALVQDDPEWDWYTIEKAEHENKQCLQQTAHNCFSFMDTGRISDACIEGTGESMVAIAKAIKNRVSKSFKRCAVRFEQDGVHFWSPRNSPVDGVVSIEDADELADHILARLAA